MHVFLKVFLASILGSLTLLSMDDPITNPPGYCPPDACELALCQWMQKKNIPFSLELSFRDESLHEQNSMCDYFKRMNEKRQNHKDYALYKFFDRFGRSTHLHATVRKILAGFIQAGAQSNHTKKREISNEILARSVELDDLGLTRLLLTYGAHPCAYTHKYSRDHVLSLARSPECAQLLLDAGAPLPQYTYTCDEYITDQKKHAQQEPILHNLTHVWMYLFSQEQRIALIEFYAQKGLVNSRDNKSNTPLHTLCSYLKNPSLQLKVATCLLKNGANARYINQEGLTPLQILTKEYGDVTAADMVEGKKEYNAFKELILLLESCKAQPRSYTFNWLTTKNHSINLPAEY